MQLSLIFCMAEVVLGVAVLIRYRMPVTMWLVLLLISFFTFLTFYSAYFNKVTDCGCFGDFIKLKPWTSFGKDVFLLVVTIALFARRRTLPNILDRRTGDAVIAICAIGFYFIGYYATIHLPYDDWRPYRVGNMIPVQMKPSEAFRYAYTMERKGEKKVFSEYPSDTTWHYVSMKHLNPQAAPKITDYRIWNDEADYTDTSFHGARLFIIVQTDEGFAPKSFEKINELVASLDDPQNQPRVTPWVLTSLSSQRMEAFRHSVQLSAPYYYSDATVLKTILRTKVGTWLMKDGRVLGKWSIVDTPSANEVRKLVSEA